jgi:hypothetical protein
MSLPPVLISSDNALWGANVRIDVSSRQIRISWPVSTNKPRVEYNFQSLVSFSNTLFRGLRLDFDTGDRIYFYPIKGQFNINGQEVTVCDWLWEIVQENKRGYATPGGITDPQWVIREDIRTAYHDPQATVSQKYQVDELAYGNLTRLSSPKEPGTVPLGIIVGLVLFTGFCLLRRDYELMGVAICCLILGIGWRIMIRQAFAYLDEPRKLIWFHFPWSGSGMKSFSLSVLMRIKTFYWGGLFILKFQGDWRWYMFAPDYSDRSVTRHSLKDRLLTLSLDTMETSASK